MMLHMIIPKVRNFRFPSANGFGTVVGIPIKGTKSTSLPHLLDVRRYPTTFCFSYCVTLRKKRVQQESKDHGSDVNVLSV